MAFRAGMKGSMEPQGGFGLDRLRLLVVLGCFPSPPMRPYIPSYYLPILYGETNLVSSNTSAEGIPDTLYLGSVPERQSETTERTSEISQTICLQGFEGHTVCTETPTEVLSFENEFLDSEISREISSRTYSDANRQGDGNPEGRLDQSQTQGDGGLLFIGVSPQPNRRIVGFGADV